MPGPCRAAAIFALLTAPLIAAPEAPDITGTVLGPDGAPVSNGSVIFSFQRQRTATVVSIDAAGRFRVVPHAPGDSLMHVIVAGLAPYRAAVTVPESKALPLPPIRLSPATYLRVRFVTPAGEPIPSAHVLRETFEVTGALLSPLDSSDPDRIQEDGTVMVGPLHRGITTMAVDARPFARMRLPDVQVTGAQALIEGGTVVLEPGALLQVDVVDGTGAPVPNQDVFLEDAVPMSPLSSGPARTDKDGRATFDRVGPGRYRVRTRSVGPCGRNLLWIVRAVSVAGGGTVRTRLVVGGTATLRLTSGGVPLSATAVTATPESAPSGPPAWLRGRRGVSPLMSRRFGPFGYASGCTGATDGDGRVTFDNFPPGPARIDVRLPGSTWVRRLTFPARRQDVAIEVPSGYLPLRVSNAHTGDPVAQADITWIAAGARVEAMTSATGEALLGGVAAAPGTLVMEHGDYQTANLKLPEPPGMLQEAALAPARARTLECRVHTTSGEPAAAAVVELVPEDPFEITHFAQADDTGLARFFDPPSGVLRLVAHAKGYEPADVRIPADATSHAVVTLSRPR